MGTIWEQIYIFVLNQLSMTYESFCIPKKNSKEK